MSTPNVRQQNLILMQMQSSELPGSNPDHWWKPVFYEDYEKRKKRLFPVVRCSEPAIWLYELVSCLPAVKRGEFKLNRRASLPPFPDLKPVEQDALELMIAEMPEWRPIWKWSVRSKKAGGYSSILPMIQVDLMCGEAPFRDLMLEWLKRQREVQGCAKPEGKKGRPSRNKKRKNCSWPWVEILGREPKSGPPFTETERTQRSSARTLARQYALRVIDTVNGAYEPIIEALRLQELQMLKLFPELFAQDGSSKGARKTSPETWIQLVDMVAPGHFEELLHLP